MANTFISIHGQGGSHSVAWTEKGIVTGGLVDANLVLTSADSVKITKTVPKGHVGGYAHIAADHGLNRLLAVGVDGDIQFWDIDSCPDKDTRVTASLNSERPGLLRIVNATVDGAHSIAHNPILPQFVTGGVTGRVTVYDANSAKPIASTTLPSNSAVLAVSYSPDGTRLAASCHDGSVHIFDAETADDDDDGAGELKSLAKISAHLLPVRGVAFSHDGNQLFTASDDGRVGVWDASAAASGSSSAIAFLSGHSHWVTAVAASPDKHLVASVSADRTCRLWDVRTRECVHVYAGHADKLWAVTFSPDGGKLATVSESGTLGVFNVAAVM